MAKSHLTAASFLAHCAAGRPLAGQRTSIGVEGEDVSALVFYPRKRTGRPGTILVIHGMSPMGNDDPRLTAVCSSFARCGYIAVSPLFPDIAAFTISGQSVSRIAKTLCAVASDTSLCPTGTLSLFAPSFSAALSIIASSGEDTAGIVRAICSVGAFSSVRRVIHDLLSREDFDEYGRLIILQNFIRHAPGFDMKASEVLREAALDNGLGREAPGHPILLAGLEGPLRHRTSRLLRDADYRLRQWQAIESRSGEVRSLMERLSVVDRIEGLKASVALIHGSGDNVIPARESIALQRRLRELGVASKLCVTPLISHGDARSGLSPVRAWELLSAFAFFFRHSAA